MKPAATAGRRHWEHRATVGHGSPLGGKVNQIFYALNVHK